MSAIKDGEAPSKRHSLWEKCADWWRLKTRLVISYTAPLQSNDPCPCGSRKKYKRCHKPSIEQIKQRMGEELLQAVVGQWYTHLLSENGHGHKQRKYRKIYERTI